MMNEIVTPENLAVFLRLLIAHLIGDFLLQRKSWIIQKQEKGWKALVLYLHVLIIGLLTYIFSGYYFNYWVPVFVMVTHLLTDIWKSTTNDNAKAFIVDQLIHLLVLIIAWYLYVCPVVTSIEWASGLLNNISFLSLLTAYIIVIWPSGYLIARLTKPWQQQVDINKGLPDAGRWIGMIERVLILTFVLVNQYAGIGFLIAAKSILRFGDIKNPENRKEAEYILIGTMISFIVAILTGIFALQLMKL
jgi:hypothetical protein